MENKELNQAYIPDEELENISGGESHTLLSTEVIVSDELGRPIKWKAEYPTYFETYHFECPKCSKYMHYGATGALYCDPCNDYFIWNLEKYRRVDRRVRKY
ncbi:MAG: hypothetical protein Q4C42_06425 [Clostridia bacterium]|nr:hypothetical protein [Clostridia bacterium]